MAPERAVALHSSFDITFYLKYGKMSVWGEEWTLFNGVQVLQFQGYINNKNKGTY
jgi:hypothetical protein